MPPEPSRRPQGHTGTERRAGPGQTAASTPPAERRWIPHAYGGPPEFPQSGRQDRRCPRFRAPCTAAPAAPGQQRPARPPVRRPPPARRGSSRRERLWGGIQLVKARRSSLAGGGDLRDPQANYGRVGPGLQRGPVPGRAPVAVGQELPRSRAFGAAGRAFVAGRLRSPGRQAETTRAHCSVADVWLADGWIQQDPVGVAARV